MLTSLPHRGLGRAGAGPPHVALVSVDLLLAELVVVLVPFPRTPDKGLAIGLGKAVQFLLGWALIVSMSNAFADLATEVGMLEHLGSLAVLDLFLGTSKGVGVLFAEFVQWLHA